MKTNFVLKGFWDNEPVYYQKINGMMFDKIPIVKLTTSIDEATLFPDIESAESEFENVSNRNFKIYPVCPICGQDYDEHPAISRKDNKSEICPNCGVGEAFMAFIDNTKKTEDLNKSVTTFLDTTKKTTNL